MFPNLLLFYMVPGIEANFSRKLLCKTTENSKVHKITPSFLDFELKN